MAAITWFCAPALAQADLEAVKREPKLEKRARKAMDNAGKAFDRARSAYRKGETEVLRVSLQEVADSVALAQKSLQETGKQPRKASKHYKRAEIGSRKLLRRLDNFRNEMSYLDRDQIDEVIASVQKIHEELLHAVMGGGK